MTTTLQEAIAAARAGDTARAQRLAADAVRDNPDDANSWYLLSQLVESDARRAAYLNKTLALAPDHARARIEFDALPAALVATLGAADSGLPAADGGEAVETTADAVLSLPGADWEATEITEADSAAAAEHMEAAAAETAAVETAVLESTAPEELPEWLQPLAPEPVPTVAAGPATEPATAVVAPRPQPATPRPKPAPTPKRNGGNQALTILLVLLGLLTVVVLAILIYLLVG